MARHVDLDRRTTAVPSTKHGQSPTQPGALLRRLDPGELRAVSIRHTSALPLGRPWQP